MTMFYTYTEKMLMDRLIHTPTFKPCPFTVSVMPAGALVPLLKVSQRLRALDCISPHHGQQGTHQQHMGLCAALAPCHCRGWKRDIYF